MALWDSYSQWIVTFSDIACVCWILQHDFVTVVNFSASAFWEKFEKLKKTIYNWKKNQFGVNCDTVGNIANANPTGIVKTS